MAGLCRKCGVLLAEVLRAEGKEYHDLCAPDQDDFFDDPVRVADRFTNGDPYAKRLRDDITDVVLWANRGSDRSRQTELGASEVGVSCLRRLGYRVANVPAVSVEQDPWPAIVGTAVHTWLDDAFTKYEKVHGTGRWETEMTVWPSDTVKGHTDLYDKELFAVIDHKNPGTTAMTEIRKGYISPQYIEQVQLYALGHVRAGRRVDRVALVFFPRAGYLSGSYVWSAPFDMAAAEAALERVKKVVGGLVYYRVMEEEANWVKIPASPSKDCTYCDWYRPDARRVSAAGCPGA